VELLYREPKGGPLGNISTGGDGKEGKIFWGGKKTLYWQKKVPNWAEFGRKRSQTKGGNRMGVGVTLKKKNRGKRTPRTKSHSAKAVRSQHITGRTPPGKGAT